MAKPLNRLFSLLCVVTVSLCALICQQQQAKAAVVANLIDTPFSTTSAGIGTYDSATLTVFLDPAMTNWMALSIGTNLTSSLPNLAGIPSIQSAQSDDAIAIVATKGSTSSPQIVIEDNDSINRRVGNQAVFFGFFNSVGSFNGSTTATYGGQAETGALTSFFNAQGAGTYTLSISFLNRYSSTAGRSGNVYLLRDVNDPPTGAVPEPASLTLFGIGALGFVGAAFRRRLR